MKKLIILLLLITNLFSLELSDFLNKNNCGANNKIIDKQIYKICYDIKMKGPKFVGYELKGEYVDKGNYKKRPPFYTEKNLKKSERTTNGDFKWTFLDKGHMANHANWDFDKNQKTVRKTYSLANITPQYPNVNRRLWLKAENAERSHAKRLGTVNVMNIAEYEDTNRIMKRVPLEEAIKISKEKAKKRHKKWREWSKKTKRKYLKNAKRTLEKRIVIPTKYYKIIWNDKENFMKCYMYKNEKGLKTKGDKLKYHITSCKKILKKYEIE